VVRFAIGFVRRYAGARAGVAVEYDMRNDVYDHLQTLDFATHDDMQTGQLVSRASGDVRMVQSLLGFLPTMSANVIFFVVSLVLMLRLSPPLTLVALVIVPVLLVLALRLRTVVYPSSWDSMAKSAEVNTVVEEAITGVRIVKGFGQERRELGRLIEAASNLFGARMRNTRISARRGATMQTIPALGQVAILALGGWLAIKRDITIGTFLAFTSYLTMLIAPVRMFAQMLVWAQNARAAAERIFELLDATSTVAEKPDAVVLDQIAGEIVFEDVRFAYLRSEPVLDGLSIRVRPGEAVALVGGSGSGKSTVAMILPRFYDVQGGAVRVDGIDVRDTTLESLRRQIGVVFEESFLFSDSVRRRCCSGRCRRTGSSPGGRTRSPTGGR
jgi:ATP-binding cassette, subfamily B, bacterial